ncbi:MAG TPA: phosphatase PAP2 family protein [Candidatus Kaiserbacteria bacterium]|nr:phosphatase PAP2 family protein [Candidatus Kaiserbacteria bacterium]
MLNVIIIFSAKYLYLLSIGLFVLYGFLTKKHRNDFILFSLLVLPVSFLFGVFAGHFFYNPRPFVTSNVVPLIAHISNNGFPSDHALLTGTLASIVSIFDAPMAIILWILAIFVGGARVLAHVHHTIDILGSYTIAIMSATILYPLISKLRAPFLRVLKSFGFGEKENPMLK